MSEPCGYCGHVTPLDGSVDPGHDKFCPGSWPDWLKAHFSDHNNWEPMTVRHALHQEVLAVATTRAEPGWCAYIGPVPGMRHDQEEGPVLAHGDKLREDIARVMFPQFKDLEYIR
jgi:hypothetical protein